MTDVPELLRTARNGCWQLKRNSWGQFLAPTSDPLANVVISEEQLEGFELNEGIAPIPAELWARWVQLCFHFARERNGNLEVSCRLLRKEDDKSQWRIVIPPQEVGGASVRADSFDGAVDIESGEVITQWPPDGWTPCGSSHSHNTMQAFFSGTDDQYELGDPGLHIVVGSIDVRRNTYTHKASITACNRRFLIDLASVADLTPVKATFHPDVLQVVRLNTWHWPMPVQSSGYATTFHPNAGDGYHIRNTEQWDSDLGDWPVGWIKEPSQIEHSLDTEAVTDAVDFLVRDAIESGKTQHLEQTLYMLKDFLDDRLDDLCEHIQFTR